jgi:hypothetical protein
MATPALSTIDEILESKSSSLKKEEKKILRSIKIDASLVANLNSKLQKFQKSTEFHVKIRLIESVLNPCFSLLVPVV